MAATLEIQADAPGRVNLIGEHTDYHDGFVMPTAIPQRTYASLRARGGRRVRVTSAAMREAVEYELGAEHCGRGWGDYVQGVTWALRLAGYEVRGFDLDLRSDVPVGSGLSSSAALEVATLRALRQAFALELTDVELARLAQRAEVEFVGAPVGIMDQMASSLGCDRQALFLDTRSLAFDRIPFPAGLELAVIDSGVAHQHAGGDYVRRRRESEEAARLLGVETLRDAPIDALRRLNECDPVIARRGRHVITENARVLEARNALASGDLVRLGCLFNESHRSLRDDYEVSVPAVDLLVDLALAQPGVFGARMTGGGFGGAIVIAAASGAGTRIATDIIAAFASRQPQGSRAKVLVP